MDLKRAVGLAVVTTLLAVAVVAMSSDVEQQLNAVAESYVKLVLAVGEHDDGYVDAYYGPEEWREDVRKSPPSLEPIRASAKDIIDRVAAIAKPEDELLALRRHYLARQVEALIARVDMLSGKEFTFDEESQALYDAVAPTHPASYFQAVLDELDSLVPGDGALAERVEAFRRQFVIPPDKLDAVFQAAIVECRKRTRQHIALPESESFDVEYVNDKPWSAYNWYKGGSHSLIQVNTDLPIYISRAIDLACHEGYPGHHVYNALLESHLARGRGWVEFTVYPLFSPQSLIAEGSANYGIEVTFPGDERVAFEREVLWPIAGLDATKAERYYQIEHLLERLSYAGNEAARGYLDGKMSREKAVDWMVRYQLSTRERAEQRLRFIDTYRSYVINYNLGKDLVRQYVEARGGTADRPQRRWQEFTALLASPRLPSGLR